MEVDSTPVGSVTRGSHDAPERDNNRANGKTAHKQPMNGGSASMRELEMKMLNAVGPEDQGKMKGWIEGWKREAWKVLEQRGPAAAEQRAPVVVTKGDLEQMVEKAIKDWATKDRAMKDRADAPRGKT